MFAITTSSLEPNARRGLLIYLKPAITGDEPRDVFNYKEASPQFPHESTVDQWFSESQFESYRMLGLHTVCAMGQETVSRRADAATASPLAAFARQTFQYLELPLPPELDRWLASLRHEPGVISAKRADSLESTLPSGPPPAPPKSF